MRYLFLIIVLSLSACSVWQRRPTMWKDIRPLWEERITQKVYHNFFAEDPSVQIHTFVIPVGDPPEVRLVIVAPLQESQREGLVSEVEKVTREVMRYASDNVYTDRVRIQVTTYVGGERKIFEYWSHQWNVLPGTTSDTQLLREAQDLQRNLARQERLE